MYLDLQLKTELSDAETEQPRTCSLRKRYAEPKQALDRQAEQQYSVTGPDKFIGKVLYVFCGILSTEIRKKDERSLIQVL